MLCAYGGQDVVKEKDVKDSKAPKRRAAELENKKGVSTGKFDLKGKKTKTNKK